MNVLREMWIGPDVTGTMPLMNPLSPSILVGFAALRTNLLRTTLSALGVIIGGESAE